MPLSRGDWVMPEVHVYVLQGQTLDQKRALIKEITEVFVRNFDVAPGAVRSENHREFEASRRRPAFAGSTVSDKAPP